MPYIPSQDDFADDAPHHSEQPASIMTATAMDLKWLTYTKTSPAEVDGLGIVAHPHPLRSHPCDGFISHAEFCTNLAEQEREQTRAKQRLQSWSGEETAHLVPAPLAPLGGIKRSDSELGRRHQQRLTDLDEEMDQRCSPMASGSGRSSYEDETVAGQDSSQSGARHSLTRTATNNSIAVSESLYQDDEEEPFMILGTVRRESRRPSSLLRLQQEQAAFSQHRRGWSPIPTPPRSRANTAERKPSLVRVGTFGPTPPDTPPRMSIENEFDNCPSPPGFSMPNHGSARRQSSILESKQRMAQAAVSPSPRHAASSEQPPPPAYHDQPLLAIAANAVRRQQQQQASPVVTPLSAPPRPAPRVPPKRKTSRSLAYASYFAAPPDYWSGSGSSTPERVATPPPPPKVERAPSEPCIPTAESVRRKPVPYFAPIPTVASTPPTTSDAHAGIFGPPKVVSSPGPDGMPSAMHTISSDLLATPVSASSSTSGHKFSHRPISTSANKLKKLRLGENISKWTTTKVGEPINTIANKLGSEAFWPMTMDKECDKAARILRAFCCGEEAASIFSFGAESRSRESADPGHRRPSHSGPAVQIPPHVMASAKGLAIFTTFRAGGLHLSGARGSGVVISRLPSTDSDVGRKWSPPSGFIVQSVGAGLRGGGGAGSEFNDCVFVLTTDAAVDAFTRPKLGLGSEIGVTPGPVMDEDAGQQVGGGGGGLHIRTTTSDVRIRAEEPILSYTRSTRGAWTGAKASGTIVAVRSDANASFYGSPARLSVDKILHGQVPVPSPTRGPLAADGTVMWPEGGSSLVRVLQDIERRM